jgi:G:T/U-mismatch repair DNA glycosylase
MTTVEEIRSSTQQWDASQKQGDVDPRDPREQARRLEQAYRAKKAERTRLKVSPPPREAVSQNIEQLVDARHTQLVADCGPGILQAFAGATEEKHDGRLRTRVPRLYHPHAQLTTIDLLILLMPEQVKASFRAALPDYKAGPSLAERAALVAACDRELAELAAAHTAVVEAAAQLNPPIKLEILDDVRQQHQEDRLQLDRTRAEAQERERSEAAIEEARHRRRTEPRTGRSEYLAGDSPRW